MTLSVTARARTHDLLVDDLHKFIIEEMRNGLVVTNGDGRVVLMNRVARELAIEADWLVRQDALMRNRRGVVDVRTVDGLGVTRDLRIEATRHGVHTFFLIRDVSEEAELAKLRRIETVGMLAASALHDFNNLLGVIGTASALLVRESAAGTRTHMLATEVSRAAERASSLSRSALKQSRIDPRTVAPIDISAVTSELIPLLEHVAGQGIDLVVETTSDVGPVVADREHLEHVLLNLVANARDAMPQGGSITIRVGRESGHVLLKIADTGEGMPAEVQKRAAEPFFTTKPAGRGTGLGLASAQRFATESGGTITVVSERGQGTVVSLRLPTLE